jgi:hypothetical protein
MGFGGGRIGGREAEAANQRSHRSEAAEGRELGHDTLLWGWRLMFDLRFTGIRETILATRRPCEENMHVQRGSVAVFLAGYYIEFRTENIAM